MPYYTLLLGHEDLAFVKEVKVELQENRHAVSIETIIPFQPKLEVAGRLCSMPIISLMNEK